MVNHGCDPSFCTEFPSFFRMISASQIKYLLPVVQSEAFAAGVMLGSAIAIGNSSHTTIPLTVGTCQPSRLGYDILCMVHT